MRISGGSEKKVVVVLLEGALEIGRKHRCFGTSARPDGSRDETSQHHALTTSQHRFRHVSQSMPAMSSISSLIPIDVLLIQDTNVVASVSGHAAAADAGKQLLVAEPPSSSKRQ